MKYINLPVMILTAIIILSDSAAYGAGKEEKKTHIIRTESGIKEYNIYWEIGEWAVIVSSFKLSSLISKTEPWPDTPLIGGRTDMTYHSSTVPGSWLKTSTYIITAGIAFIPNNRGFMNHVSYDNIKGLMEAASFTSLTTALTKNAFGRKRPSYDNYPSDRKETSGRQSFISGHSSQSFCLATYSSLFVFEHLGDIASPLALTCKIITALALHSMAGYVAYTRVKDNKHFVSDVVAGGITGSSISFLVYAFQNNWFSGSDPKEDTEKGHVSFNAGYINDTYSVVVMYRF